MTDEQPDIVTRIRSTKGKFYRSMSPEDGLCPVCEEAADEIERLRAENARLHELLKDGLDLYQLGKDACDNDSWVRCGSRATADPILRRIKEVIGTPAEASQ